MTRLPLVVESLPLRGQRREENPVETETLAYIKG
jgi:hypothetical protein